MTVYELLQQFIEVCPLSPDDSLFLCFFVGVAVLVAYVAFIAVVIWFTFSLLDFLAKKIKVKFKK